jgi:hypothetical protein
LKPEGNYRKKIERKIGLSDSFPSSVFPPANFPPVILPPMILPGMKLPGIDFKGLEPGPGYMPLHPVGAKAPLTANH